MAVCTITKISSRHGLVLFNKHNFELFNIECKTIYDSCVTKYNSPKYIMYGITCCIASLKTLKMYMEISCTIFIN